MCSPGSRVTSRDRAIAPRCRRTLPHTSTLHPKCRPAWPARRLARHSRQRVRLTFTSHRSKVGRSAGSRMRHVQAHTHRQSRRDRLPDNQDRASNGNRDGRGLFRGRPRRAARRDGGRGGPDRSGRPAAESYLVIEKIVEACERTGAEAVHPGYGFLSERAAFPRRLAQAGIVFIGPNARGHRRHGRQDRIARKLRPKPGFPPFPAISGSSPTSSTRKSIADAIGYPVMIKATAGGGGKGMRVAYDRSRARGRLCARALGSEILLRRRSRVHGKIHHRSAAHRNSGAGRQARQCDLISASANARSSAAIRK